MMIFYFRSCSEVPRPHTPLHLFYYGIAVTDRMQQSPSVHLRDSHVYLSKRCSAGLEIISLSYLPSLITESFKSRVRGPARNTTERESATMCGAYPSCPYLYHIQCSLWHFFLPQLSQTLELLVDMAIRLPFVVSIPSYLNSYIIRKPGQYFRNSNCSHLSCGVKEELSTRLLCPPK